MPLYEFICEDCQTHFEVIRSVSQVEDQPPYQGTVTNATMEQGSSLRLPEDDPIAHVKWVGLVYAGDQCDVIKGTYSGVWKDGRGWRLVKDSVIRKYENRTEDLISVLKDIPNQ